MTAKLLSGAWLSPASDEGKSSPHSLLPLEPTVVGRKGLAMFKYTKHYSTKSTPQSEAILGTN